MFFSSKDDEDASTSIVKYGEHPDDDKKPEAPNRGFDPFFTALLWCVLGAVSMTSFSVVGVAMVAFGFATAFSKEVGAPKTALCVVGALAGMGLGIGFNQLTLANGLEALVNGATAFTLAALVVRRRATVTSDYLVASLVTAAYLALALGLASLAGVDPAAAVKTLVDSALDIASSQYGLEMAAMVRQLEPVLMLLWPFAYFVLAGLNVLAGHFGARMATMQPGSPSRWSVTDFEAPTWSVVALILGIALFAFSSVFGAHAAIAQSAGLTVGMAVRFVFTMQGFAVLSWWLNQKHAGCLLRFALVFLAVDLEASFFVLSILGLVDFWANFRRMPRGGAPRLGA